jgi:hypothetical protein
VAAILRKALRLLSWVLPHGVHVARKKWLLQRQYVATWPLTDAELASNAALRDRHLNGQCFILGNGPSAGALDLALLAGKTVISVSNGYLHRDYAAIKPRYHCVPQITYGRMAQADVVAWFGEMHEGIGDAELFLNETEAELVRKHNLFPGRKIHYLALRENFDELEARDVIDISRPVPRVQSVPLMALMIAMYVRVKEIVLLGVDHDHFKTGRYTYAFKVGVQDDKDISVEASGQVNTLWHDDFQALARLWRQYRVISEIAQKNGISIINATPGGELDEFARVSLADVLSRGGT